tara:strand:- start:1678 stop:2100 length:423 start_codon:yes stop_codon:yes gene_type:complete
MKKSKIKTVQGNGTYKDMFIYEISLENGDVGNIYRKTEEAKVDIGQEIEYDLKPSGTLKILTDYNREEFIKKTTISNSSKDNIQLMIVKQSCLKAAVEMDKSGDRSQIIDDAQYFTDWVMDDCCAKKENKTNNSNENIPF